jgi:putative transposase
MTIFRCAVRVGQRGAYEGSDHRFREGMGVQDRDGARILLSVLGSQLRRLRAIWADGAYAGGLPSWVRGLRKWGKVRLEIVRKAKGERGFAVVPWRWIVERTFAWLGRYRRLKSDYERLPETTEAIIHIAMIRLMVRRLVG